MANPNNVYKNMAKNPWTPVLFHTTFAAARDKLDELVSQRRKARMTSTWLKREQRRVYSVWVVPENNS